MALLAYKHYTNTKKQSHLLQLFEVVHSQHN